jgi:hypothetical protein
MLPSTLEQLQPVWGLAAKRIEQHGTQLLEVLSSYRGASKGRKTDPDVDAKHVLAKRNGRSGTGKKAMAAAAAEALLDDLSADEKIAFLALREWKRARGRELGYNNPCGECFGRAFE